MKIETFHVNIHCCHANLAYHQEMSKFEEPDILFNMLNCLKILCLQGECLYLARKDHPQFLAYIQEKMLIPRWVQSMYEKQVACMFKQLLIH